MTPGRIAHRVTDVAKALSKLDPRARAFAALLRKLSSQPRGHEPLPRYCASFRANRTTLRPSDKANRNSRLGNPVGARFAAAAENTRSHPRGRHSRGQRSPLWLPSRPPTRDLIGSRNIPAGGGFGTYLQRFLERLAHATVPTNSIIRLTACPSPSASPLRPAPRSAARAPRHKRASGRDPARGSAGAPAHG